MAYKEKADFDAHWCTHIGKKFICDDYGAQYSEETSLATHISDEHSEDAPIIYRCTKCPSTFTHKGNLGRHMRDCHENDSEDE